MASSSLATSQPRVDGDTVSQSSPTIGGKYIVVGTGVMGVPGELLLLHDKKSRLNKAAVNIDLIVKVENFRLL